MSHRVVLRTTMSRDIKRFTVIMEAFRPDSKMGHDEVRRVVEDAVRRGHGDELPLVACELGNLEALKMTLEAGCHLTSECTVAAMRVQNFAMIFFLQERENGGLDSASCAEAAFHGRMHILQNFFRGRVDAQAALRAAEGGQLLALRYAHENGVELNGEMAMRASERGHVNCLKFILAYGVELTSAEVKRCGLLAVNGGHIGVLEVLQNHRQFMWTEKFCVAASRNGDVFFLQWLIEHGCAYTERTLAVAREGLKDGHRACAEYLVRMRRGDVESSNGALALRSREDAEARLKMLTCASFVLTVGVVLARFRSQTSG